MSPVPAGKERRAGSLASRTGAIVAAASARDAEEIYQLRTLLDPLALRDSLEHSDVAHRGEIAAAFARMLETGPGAPDLVDAFDRHAAFHATLLARCRSRWLLR